MSDQLSLELKRRRPTQRRAVQTVESVLDAVLQIARTDGPQAINTNRIAEVAGVSVGSVYQYFPDKRAIFASLRQQHLDELDRIIGRNLVDTERADLQHFVAGLVQALFELHARNEGLYRLLAADDVASSESSLKFRERLEAAFRIAISARNLAPRPDRTLGLKSFVAATILESLAQTASAARPLELSPEAVKTEAVQAILNYLSA